ncbi:MAG: ATP-binding cassette domain-containing protein, partial [Planctomycetota bacterium]
MSDPVLRVRDLSVCYPGPRSRPWRPAPLTTAVAGLNLDLAAGEILALVGESGCGKSSSARAIARLQPSTTGSVILCGTELTTLHGRALRHARRPLQMVFQDPFASLDPRGSAAAIIGEGLDHGNARLSRSQR